MYYLFITLRYCFLLGLWRGVFMGGQVGLHGPLHHDRNGHAAFVAEHLKLFIKSLRDGYIYQLLLHVQMVSHKETISMTQTSC